MALASLVAAEAALKPFIPRHPETNYTLDRISDLLAALGSPQEAIPVIHVAGTSGKTSTCYFIRGLLQAAGFRTGLTVSPHIATITERVQVNGGPLPEAAFCSYLEDVLTVVEGTGLTPSYFEILIATAYHAFASEAVDFAIIETGLGGLLDASNTVRRGDKLCVITDIGHDHSEILGATIAEIATQKAGIIQPGNVLILQDQDAEPMDVISGYAKSKTARTVVATEGSTRQVGRGLPRFQGRNLALAVSAVELLAERGGWSLQLPNDALIEQMQPPVRMEVHHFSDKLIVLDGAHNGQKLRSLADALLERGWTDVALLASPLQAPDSKLDEVFSTLRRMSDSIIVTEFSVVQDVGKHSLTTDDSTARAGRARFENVQAVPRLSAAVDVLLASDRRVLLVTGSLYLVAHVRRLLSDADLITLA